MPDKTYTLEEAKLELNRKKCGLHGHDLDIIVTGGGVPVRLICQCCGKSWPVGDEYA